MCQNPNQGRVRVQELLYLSIVEPVFVGRKDFVLASYMLHPPPSPLLPLPLCVLRDITELSQSSAR